MTPPETTNEILPPLPVLDLARLETDDTIFYNDEDDDNVTGVVLSPPPASSSDGRESSAMASDASSCTCAWLIRIRDGPTTAMPGAARR